MASVYLFDWGDTLMVNILGATGKMKDWNYVEAIDGAVELLEELSIKSKIYIATGAVDSNEKDIEIAFSRVGLNQYISGYFCFENVGYIKGSSHYLKSILFELGVFPTEVTVVGDSYETDIVPAIKVGMNVIWLKRNESDENIEDVRVVSSLREIGQ